MAELTGIPHSSDTLVLELIHRLSSDPADEHIGLDDLKVTLTGISSPLPFSILEVDYNAGLGEVVIEWPSVPGQSFAVDRSFDLGPEATPGGWQELDDGWPAAVAPNITTTYRDATLPANATHAFYRVRKE